MALRKDKIKGILGTIIVHLLALILLFFLGFTTPLPLPGEEGVEVDLGFSETGSGNNQQETPAPMEEETPPPIMEETPVVEEQVVTNDAEDTPLMEEPVEEPVKEEEVVEEPPEEEPPVEEKVVEPEPPKPVVNTNALYKGKQNQSSEGGNEGKNLYPGDQGKKEGTEDSGTYDTQGGMGNGISFSLGGRSAKALPKPTYNSKDQGKVVVTIKVNRQGFVIAAEAGARGTSVTDQKLWREAEEAAKRARFSPKPDAPEIQRGTITYNFIRLN
ncbi:MAG: energy transducer TonB [Bacteroidetes bacterium]|nr:MAG: energy transducer TonB [Bacteroidota bacterium]PIE88278.1 MAG: energy transducer TonB [Bacteroidota bacterium]